MAQKIVDGRQLQNTTNVSYKDVMDHSGMSWSHILKQTSAPTLPRLALTVHKENTLPAMKMSSPRLMKGSRSDYNISKHQPAGGNHYHWRRTEEIEKSLSATDRPYRNTYGDNSSAPSKLCISTGLPSIEPGKSVRKVENKRFTGRSGVAVKTGAAGRQLARIYNLIHQEYTGTNYTVFKSKLQMSSQSSLPTILPNYSIKVMNSVYQVTQEERQQKLEAAVSKSSTAAQQSSEFKDMIGYHRPLTSEKVRYRPITQSQFRDTGDKTLQTTSHPETPRLYKSAETFNRIVLSSTDQHNHQRHSRTTNNPSPEPKSSEQPIMAAASTVAKIKSVAQGAAGGGSIQRGAPLSKRIAGRRGQADGMGVVSSLLIDNRAMRQVSAD